MSELLPGQKIQRLVTEAQDIAYQKGRESERKSIIRQLEQVAIQQQKVLDFNPRRKDKSGREFAIATTYQLIALIKGNQSDTKPNVTEVTQ